MLWRKNMFPTFYEFVCLLQKQVFWSKSMCALKMSGVFQSLMACCRQMEITKIMKHECKKIKIIEANLSKQRPLGVNKNKQICSWNTALTF